MELDGLSSRVMSLLAVTLIFDLRPFDLISMFQVPVHTWPNFGENLYSYCIHPVFRVIACSEWPWPL